MIINLPVAVAKGGTGATDASGARTKLGVAALTAVMLLTGSQAMTGALDAGSFNINNVATPSTSGQAANKGYVDTSISTAIAGYTYKDPARVVATSNITLSGTQTIDGVSVIAGDRVLVTGQSTAANNGLYVCAAGSWSRATDADASAEVKAGMNLLVTEGTTYADTNWLLTTDGTITLGSTSLTFTQINAAGSITAGNGLTKTGNTLDVVGTTNRISVAADSIDISSSYVGQTSITTLGTIATGVWNGTNVAVANGGTGSSTASGARTNLGAAPLDAQYVVLAGNSELSNESVLTAGTGISISTATISIDSTVVTKTGSDTLTNKTLTSPIINTPQIKQTVSKYTSSHTITATETGAFLYYKVSAGSQQAVLPAGAANLVFEIKNAIDSTNSVDIVPNGSDTIEGAASMTLSPGDGYKVVWIDSTEKWRLF